MQQLLIALLSGILFLTACAQNGTMAPAALPQESTGTPSPNPTSAITLTPTATPTDSTLALAPGASVTPLPTIPTFTPTFDVRTIATVTPASKAECPEENPEIVADFSGPYIYGYDEVLTYLNSGGSLAQLQTALSARDPDWSWGKIIDLTGDGLGEVVYRGLGGYSLLSCRNGKSQDLFNFAVDDFRVELEEIID